MLKVYSHHDRFMVWQIKQWLEQNGIPCFVKNEFAIGAMGELSPFDVLPEVWLTDEGWLAKAQKLIKDFEHQPLQHSWLCERCQESNDGNFELCWQCGTPAEP
ncbi:MAG: DUF2007 domain-containing protein [Paraglaciecola sp.]|uniref:putative signal transducing protein n=1 Tax=Pseudomonadati TaxID=3379134 RepID=UPI00273E43BB|nr:DUF2007 domain-containing protein [Paraglaciecola sp.]MDP5032884.1 DUF2007 domain-containing protein [Paraglaciecola sp.]MDP5132816.1 DUF2007 domain-containing protein [Paraglaciecola sp.]